MNARQWRSWGLSIGFGAVCGAMVVLDTPGNRTASGAAVAVSGVIAAGVGLVRASRHPERFRPSAARPLAGSVGLGVTERAAYARWVTNPVLAIVGVGFAAAMLASGRTLPMIGAGAWLYLVAGVACVRVHIDDRGVKVTAWPLLRPQRWVPLEHVRGASVVDVGWHWLWGLRWVASRRTWAFLVSGRQALEVATNNGESLLVTIPDAAIAAGLVNDLVARTRPPA